MYATIPQMEPFLEFFNGRGVFTLLLKVQLHVSALDNSHLQVLHNMIP
jgi:hypothetical protein